MSVGTERSEKAGPSPNEKPKKSDDAGIHSKSITEQKTNAGEGIREDVKTARVSSSASTLNEETSPRPSSPWRRILAVLTYAPKHLRHDPSKPLRYSLWLNLLFGLAGMSTVANLYYSHPILNIIAQDFRVSNEESSYIPTLAQAGYAGGLLFINPLADSVKRRPLVLGLMLVTALLWIGLCVTQSFKVFMALSFLTSVTTVTPQIMLPLVADLAPLHRRATAVSIVTSGLLLGLLFARVMSGVVTTFVSWRIVYWIALGLQSAFVVVLYFTMPDYPRTNKNLSYWRSLWSIFTILIRSPVLVQACIVGLFTGACFTSYWTTLTFLLSGPPYHYSPLIIGLFALIGIAIMGIGPVFSRFVIDKCAPLITAIMGIVFALTTIIIGTYTGTFTVAGPVIMAMGIDIGFQISQISNRSSIYSIEPSARNRINTAYMLSIFIGQLMGTAVGNHLYAVGGWIRSGNASIGFMCAALAVCFSRGPWETHWVGWRGGWGIRRRDLGTLPPADQENGVSSSESAEGEKDIEAQGGKDGVEVLGRKDGMDGTKKEEDKGEQSRRTEREASSNTGIRDMTTDKDIEAAIDTK